VFTQYNFDEIRLPIVERNDLFQRSVGETTDIVEKEMFTFGDPEDKKGTYSLRPELTPGTIRALIEQGLFAKKNFWKVWYLGPAFRKERPQKGRYRQFTQIGVEAVGSPDPLIDAETMILFSEILKAVGVTAWELRVNSIGCKECRPQYREALKEWIRPRLETLDENCKRRFERNVFRILDCKVDADKLKDAPKSIDYLCAACKTHMGVVEKHGRGMFATRMFLKGELIERAPVVVIDEKKWPNAAKTILSDYAFDWGEKDEHAAIAMGYISLYNHSYSPNAQLEQMMHGDHFGGMAELASKVTIKEFIDHGGNVQPAQQADDFLKTTYPQLYAKSKHTVVKPGDKIAMTGVEWRIVESAGAHINTPVPGAGKPNPACAAFKPQEEDKTENAQSVGSHITFGKFRVLHLGDLTVNKEFDLMCPTNRLGPVDLWVVSHHGQAISNSEVLVHAIQPRVAILNNGTRKGGQPDAMSSAAAPAASSSTTPSMFAQGVQWIPASRRTAAIRAASLPVGASSRTRDSSLSMSLSVISGIPPHPCRGPRRRSARR
jgi:hypothetical protein